MASARAALRKSVCLRPRLSSPYCWSQRLLVSEATATLIPAPLDISDATPEGQSVNAIPDLPPESFTRNFRARNLKKFLEDQREISIEFRNQLKDQRILLSLICEKLCCCKSEFKTSEDSDSAKSDRKNPGVVNEAANQTHTLKTEEVPGTRTTIQEIQPESGDPTFQSGKHTSNGSLLIKKGPDDADKFEHPDWPEWGLFLDCLRPYASMEGKLIDKSDEHEPFDNTALLKSALVKFAQAHEAAFRKLPRKDLAVFVQYDFPSMDERTAVGKKRIRNFLVMDEGEGTKAKLTDVVRLIYRAVRSIPSLGGALPSQLKSVLARLLQALTKLGGSSRTMEGDDQKIGKGDKVEGLNNGANVVEEAAVLPALSPSAHQDERAMITGAAVTFPESPKFSSLKERVDARRERLARQRIDTEVAKTLPSQLLLMKELEQKTPKQARCKTDRTKAMKEKVAMNLKAFDAIIESDNSDGCVNA